MLTIKKTGKNCKFKKSWKSKFGYLIRDALKNGVLCPLVYECDTLADLESFYNSVKNGIDRYDMEQARYLEDIYNYGDFYILEEDFSIEDLNKIFGR